MRALIATLLIAGLSLSQALAQSASNFSVKYMVTYDTDKKLYTAWIIPEYSTPNSNNGDTEEKGLTAQFTLKVPTNFLVSNIKDVRGTWEKSPIKIGRQKEFNVQGVSPFYEYYVIGKTPSETNYGEFKEGEPVALFTFTGQNGNPADVTVLENNDSFIKIADERMSLNVASSFYSRSGQAANMNARPLDQFARPTTMNTVLTEMAKKLTAIAQLNGVSEGVEEMSVIAYPNPVAETLNVKYFSQQDDAIRLEVVDMKGNINQTSTQEVKRGVNTFRINMEKSAGGTYLLRTVVGGKVVNRKIVKDS
ncbi:T9SS type A sorting domain-containing protein [Spirosoma sp. KUDC1026]|uniref:T9SS type A sorting domain-containing protein n=1 Tax=Spirosoma sp. KUDC1026 TaxID=2745947 RepID=UPI00159BE42A|nr:T9SS type A sorting domain-containing protein [Spirosoma sp. KUDC1026]QKZ11340.1 T9SS type A sorting domain-containing protein [Spirosoma sp. KUDC1026]